MTDHRFAVTFFPDVTGRQLTNKLINLDELRIEVLNTTAKEKAKLPLLKLATFGNKQTDQHSLRHNANVESITGAEGDYDAKEMTLDQAVELISQARLKALLYTSPSHTASEPKWRILLPTSQPLPPSERARMVGRANGVLGGVLAGESFTLSQAFYHGSINGNPDHRAVITEGDYIDLRVDLDATARGKRSSSDDAAQPGSDKQADPDLVYAAMAVIPNDVDWYDWNRMGMACWLATNGDERGFAAFDMWSRKWSRYDKDKDTTRERWQSYHASPPTEIGAGTIFQKADQVQPGWRALAGLPIDKVNEILRLSRLPFAQYDTVRKESAKQLGLRVTTLDEIVGRLASRIMTGDDDDDTNKQGTRFEFAAIEPWPDAVDGAVLTADMVKAIRNHVILGEHQALAVALWIIHTHALEAAEHTPRLQIKSPTMRCGKSTLLDSVAAMVPKGLATQNISTAALFRIIEMKEPTLLIDEADNFFKNSEGRDNPETLGILNSGYRRIGGWFVRTVGEDFEPRLFKTFSPVAFAWLTKRGVSVAAQLEDRCITIELRRRLPDEKIERLRSTRTGHLRQLGRRAARWFADHRLSLSDADPSLPEQLDDRAMDNWRPLVAIADAISADLGQKARAAALKIAEESTGGEEDAGIMALADVAAVIKDRLRGLPPANLKGISSKYLVETLINKEDRPWRQWRRGEPLTEKSLSNLLKPFNLKSKRMRIGADSVRGYLTLKVLEAAERYVKEEAEEEMEEDPM